MRFRRLTPCRTDVLIFDSLGVEYLKEAVPQDASYSVLDLREGVPIVFSLRFLIAWLAISRESRLGLRSSYFIALIDAYQPKAVLSFVDTHSALGRYQRYRPEIPTISVQNALRYPHEMFTEAMPTYYALGRTAKKFLDQEKITYKHCLAAGSLPLGIFLSKNRIKKEADKITFISSYRVAFEEISPEEKNGGYVCALARTHKQAFLHALRYSEERKFRLTVIAKGKVRYEGEHFLEEKQYFDGLSLGRPYTLSSTVKDTYNSYHHALAAQLVIAVDSTLAYEAFSAGARVLFCWGADYDLLNYSRFFLEALPDAILLKSSDYHEFVCKVDSLLNMSDESYDALTKGCRSEYVTYDANCPVHERIKQEVSKEL